MLDTNPLQTDEVNKIISVGLSIVFMWRSMFVGFAKIMHILIEPVYHNGKVFETMSAAIYPNRSESIP